MQITVHGSGYVGLVTAACFAHMGNDVLCIDIDADKVRRLAKGEVPLHEPGLPELVRAGLAAGLLRFSADPAAGVAHGAVQFIAVGTPPDAEGAADLRAVLSVAEAIGTCMQAPRLVVGKSTVPVGTADRVRERIARVLTARGVRHAFDVVANPEFLKEGAAVEDFMRPDRIIIGATDPASIATLRSLYAPFTGAQEQLLVMRVRDAEFTKYAANCMLATRISLMNEFANLAEHLGVDIEAVRAGIGSDPRIGHHFLRPGAGYGGSCFPKDVQALLRTAADAGHDLRILQATAAVNRDQHGVLGRKVLAHFGADLRGRTLAVWGLAFKPGTDDMREAPSRRLLEDLWAAGATVRAHDPAALGTAARLYGPRADLVLCSDEHSALDGADALVVVTEWPAFLSPDFAGMKRRLRAPVIFDGRNLYDPAQMRALGFTHHSIGRPSVPG